MGVISEQNLGKVIVASDIHGNLRDYLQIQKRFASLRDQGKVDSLLFLGDLIHAYGDYEDRSAEILDDLIDSRDPDVQVIMGNHELGVLYHLNYFKPGFPEGLSFVERFEQSILGRRKKYIDFIREMPYAIRTPAGVTFTHAGPHLKFGMPHDNDEYKRLSEFSHDSFLRDLKEKFEPLLDEDGSPIQLDDSEFTPEIGEQFFDSGTGHYLWNLMFNADELKYDPYQYGMVVDRFLLALSKESAKQQFLVTGHLPAEDGYETLGGKLLRISSSYGAKDDANKMLALIDSGKTCESMDELISGLIPLYEG